MKQFKTASGSLYEVDEDNKCVRRILNEAYIDATDRQGNNEWRRYNFISDIMVGHHVLIFWDKQTTPLLTQSIKNATPATETSRVVEILPVNTKYERS